MCLHIILWMPARHSRVAVKWGWGVFCPHYWLLRNCGFLKCGPANLSWCPGLGGRGAKTPGGHDSPIRGCGGGSRAGCRPPPCPTPMAARVLGPSQYEASPGLWGHMVLSLRTHGTSPPLWGAAVLGGSQPRGSPPLLWSCPAGRSPPRVTLTSSPVVLRPRPGI